MDESKVGGENTMNSREGWTSESEVRDSEN